MKTTFAYFSPVKLGRFLPNPPLIATKRNLGEFVQFGTLDDISKVPENIWSGTVFFLHVKIGSCNHNV